MSGIRTHNLKTTSPIIKDGVLDHLTTRSLLNFEKKLHIIVVNLFIAYCPVSSSNHVSFPAPNIFDLIDFTYTFRGAVSFQQ